MPGLASPLPVRRPELLIRPLGDRGRYVAKDPTTGQYFNFGEEENFLLGQLDGKHTAEDISTAFLRRFEQPLPEEDLEDFLTLARTKGLVESEVRSKDSQDRVPKADPSRPSRRQSFLYWRKRLFDPDGLCNWLEPKIRFFWTPAFLIVSAISIIWAVGLMFANGRELASCFAGAMRWETLALVWLTLFGVTMAHEFAHGLTCKHYGGDVHEIGFLLLYFMPCFYCNVSDAWLFREKSKRVCVTFAGGYFELFVWAISVFVWRLTMTDSLVNYLALVVLTVCGLQTLFNFNPLLKLDGYYLLSDWLDVPNLRQRAIGRFKAHLRHLLWGAPRAAPEQRGRLLVAFGLATWLYSLVFLLLMIWGLFWFLGSKWGALGMVAIGMLGLVSAPSLLGGLTNGEVRNMIRGRRIRTVAWLVILAGAAAALCFIDVEDRATGAFQIRTRTRAELRAPVAGFVQAVHFDEGERVSPAALVVQLEIPDLASRIAQKLAGVDEVKAKLRLLEAGTRPEEIDQQRRRVERMTAWRDLAQNDLDHAQNALREELNRLDQQIAQHRAETTAAEETFQRARNLRGKGVLTDEQFQEAERKHYVSQSLLAQAQAQKRNREVLGTREAIA